MFRVNNLTRQFGPADEEIFQLRSPPPRRDYTERDEAFIFSFPSKRLDDFLGGAYIFYSSRTIHALLTLQLT